MRLSVRRDEAGLVHEAGELAERAGDVLHAQRPRQNAHREQNRQGLYTLRNATLSGTQRVYDARARGRAALGKVPLITLKCFYCFYTTATSPAFTECVYLLKIDTSCFLSIFSYF